MPPSLRTTPKPAPTSVVGLPRDLDVLEALSWAGFLSTHQVERLFFPSRRRAQRRLRALLDHVLVRAHVPAEALHLENIYTLTAKGRERLIETGRVEPPLPVRRLPRLGKLRHALAVRDVFVAFAAAEGAGLFEVQDIQFDDDLVKHPRFSLVKLIPDVLVTFVDSPRWVGFEVDLGSEGHATWRGKLAAWKQVLAGDREGELVIVAYGDGRCVAIGRLVAEASLARGFVIEQGRLDEFVRSRGYPQGLSAPPVRAERRALRLDLRGTVQDSGALAPTFRVVRPEEGV